MKKTKDEILNSIIPSGGFNNEYQFSIPEILMIMQEYADQETSQLKERVADLLKGIEIVKKDANELNNEVIRLKQLVNAQDEYIKLLGKEVEDNAVFLDSRGIRCTQEVYERGCKLRELIKSLVNQEPNTEK